MNMRRRCLALLVGLAAVVACVALSPSRATAQFADTPTATGTPTATPTSTATATNTPPAVACGMTPIPMASCRRPILQWKSSLSLKNRSPDSGDRLMWAWRRGAWSRRCAAWMPA